MNYNWQKFDIDISKVIGGKTTCPKCSHTRKNKKDKCLSVNLEDGVFCCHHCDFKGSARDYKPKKEYAKPLPRLEKVSQKTIHFFEDERKISNNTLLRMKISEAREWMADFKQEVMCICFNYFRDDQLVNIKFRGPKKSFKLSKDAELIFYNLDAIKDENECVIVEGEIDCLTLQECGIHNSVSVPNGASKGSQKLEYLDNCWEYFENKTKIVLAVDSDEAGNKLRDELARRLGKEKCFVVEYPENCKDVNEALIKHGKEMVVQVIEQAKQIPLEGIVSMDDMYATIVDWYINGYPKGSKTHIPGFDELLTFVPGQLTVITGIPGHGKDEFANWIMTSLAKFEDWSWGICAFEESAPVTVTKLIEKFTDKGFDIRTSEPQRVSQSDFETGIGLVDKYFRFIDTENVQPDLDGILEKAEQMVKRFGIKGFCLNPWNWIEHIRQEFMSETEYVSTQLTKILAFANKFQVHFFLMAHPIKRTKGKDGKYEIPTLYSISGSANFFNKTHNGITVYRDYSNNNVDVYVQKVKQHWLGKIGFCQFSYNTSTRKYNSLGADNSNGVSKNFRRVTEEEKAEELPF